VKQLLLLALSAVLALYSLRPQWRSFEQMGEARSQNLQLAPQRILVGVCWPFAVNGDGMADGLRLAHEEINAGGLAGDIPVQLILRDDNFDRQRAKDIAREFSANPDMSAVLGYYDEGIAIEASALYESARLLHIIVGANDTALTAHGFKYIVRTVVSSDKIARSLARISMERGYKRFALVWEEDAYEENLAYQYHVGLDAFAAAFVFQRSYPREHPDFRLVANQLKAHAPDLIFFAGLEPGAGDFLRKTREVGNKSAIIGAFSDTPEMRARAGAALEGAMYYSEYDVDSPIAENKAFVAKFRARYGRDPDTWAAQGYDALRILARAVRATRSGHPLDLSYAIRFMDAWEGANGRYKFDARGELEDKPIFLKAFRNGMPVTIQESDPVPVLTVR
jgi:branched-chain amino acid transport system substrate-binding protein